MTTLTPRRAPAPRRSRTAPAAGPHRASSARTARLAGWDSPVTSYYLIGGVAAVLLCLGLVMVLSSSTIDSMARTGSPFTGFLTQLQYAVIGVPLALVAARLPVVFFRRTAWFAMMGAAAMQLLVFTPLAVGEGGNNAWVELAPNVTFQPSEFAKLGLALWLGAVLAAKRSLLARWGHVIFPALVVSGAVLALVLVTNDLGTALVLVALVGGALWVAGVPMRMFAAAGLAVAAVVAFLAATSPNRVARIMALFGSTPLDPQGLGYQSRLAQQALGTGGIGGVGLGASREKWWGLPAAHNDFILAVIGEELGLLGTLLVLALFALLAVGVTRIIRRHPDPFVKITTGAIGAWILAQALVNIGVVIGVLPVIGIPLPLVSAGGSSLIVTLVALGILLAFARSEPGARVALEARRGTVRRGFAVLTSGMRHTGRATRASR
ncbi:cell cycle protein [Beutenbergia cavernae DSM 12333]|uniref:Probable peptidoglycan glycosyltransferase FtsW n=1 Tax=Beutenbergia cavernae (strain ATCC BAA-8 / DSM 12333 / CCUG 43141 / JCM 11478 / NBRC 16432 / NCIMB 13614 / HKI 0122) TaxID=471853 RepID=C5BW60_BEUC1|nr:FtsW/RodA/SpoVE family cell cycle protein [Beutenbergia cavernae]ACQ80661.1 cell cycle protein [Beutenbergia cavernae DSM 12333]